MSTFLCVVYGGEGGGHFCVCRCVCCVGCDCGCGCECVEGGCCEKECVMICIFPNVPHSHKKEYLIPPVKALTFCLNKTFYSTIYEQTCHARMISC
jgi:hypothetical protein